MSTRSTLIIEHADGTAQAIYVHNDGYLEGVGQALKCYHNSREAIQALIDMGDHSQIYGKETLSYKEWRNEDVPAGTFTCIREAAAAWGNAYNYALTKEDELVCYNSTGDLYAY